MKRKKVWIPLLVLFLVLAVAAALAVWQRANIQAAIQGVQQTPKEIEQKIAETEQRVQRALDENEDVTVRMPTEDEIAGLIDGSISRETLIERLIEQPDAEIAGSTDSEKNIESEDGTRLEKDGDGISSVEKADKTVESEVSEADEFESAAHKQYREDLSKLIAEVYVLQAEYNGLLQSMVEQAKQEYSLKSDAERTKSSLVSWAAGYVGKATQMEKECDTKIDTIAGKILTLIEKNGGDASIVDEIIDAYSEEKRLKKSWYLSQLKGKGLI